MSIECNYLSEVNIHYTESTKHVFRTYDYRNFDTKHVGCWDGSVTVLHLVKEKMILKHSTFIHSDHYSLVTINYYNKSKREI